MSTSVATPVASRSTTRSGARVTRRVAFVGMSASLLAFFVAAGAPTPLLPLYEQQWGFAPPLLTVAFGVYAFAMIAALLVFGSLSDYVGRRPVLIGALALELASMVVFLFSASITWLIVGRVLQGIATGVASSTFGAAIVELAPENRKKLGTVMSSLATTAGLAIGALFSGLVAYAMPGAAASTVWLVLVVVMAAGTGLAVLAPETSSSRRGALASLVPRVSVPRPVRPLFVRTSPSIVAVFLLTALYLGLVPTVLSAVLHVTAPLVGGGVNFVLFAAGTLAAVITSGVHPHPLKTYGNVGMIIGVALFVAGVATDALPLVWASAVVAGTGAGAAFAGSNRGLIPEVAPHDRARLFSAIFVLAYVTFGGSAILAGQIATVIGVEAMAIGFGLTAGLVAGAGVLVGARRSR
ncbi:MFS transporter [Microbacterium sp. B2969]|uniref:MFS transporter n=1 Tax=Microbacterium alkaliflavum TaxID=3248839 RepID=A0ABW7Q632_9MICO